MYNSFATFRVLEGERRRLAGGGAMWQRYATAPTAFTVSPIYRASSCSPKYRVYKQTNVNPPLIFRFPREAR